MCTSYVMIGTAAKLEMANIWVSGQGKPANAEWWIFTHIRFKVSQRYVVTCNRRNWNWIVIHKCHSITPILVYKIRQYNRHKILGRAQRKSQGFHISSPHHRLDMLSVWDDKIRGLPQTMQHRQKIRHTRYRQYLSVIRWLPLEMRADCTERK